MCLTPGRVDGVEVVDLESELEDVGMAHYKHMVVFGSLLEDMVQTGKVQAVVVDHSS